MQEVYYPMAIIVAISAVYLVNFFDGGVIGSSKIKAQSLLLFIVVRF